MKGLQSIHSLVLGTLSTTILLFTQVQIANAITLGGLLGRETLSNQGAEVLFEQAFEQIIDDFGVSISADQELTDSFWESLGFETVLIAGTYSFYLSLDNQIRDVNVSVTARAFTEQKEDTLSQNFSTMGISEQGAPYFSSIAATATTGDGLFSDDVSADILGIYLASSFGNPSGETLFGGGFSYAFIDDRQAVEALSLESIALRVPEPLTILGSIAALGMGTALKKKHSKTVKESNLKT